MTAYYNEIDPYAAQWLRNLIAAGHIAPGDVDTRDIRDVRPDDLKHYTQCHFFAGIGVWSYALRRAGWDDNRRVWTGSCPCQPFSAAGAGLGFADERHLWPSWYWLIAQQRPSVVFGEQVASSAVEPWIDLVSTDMEALGAAFGAIAFPSAGVGAPMPRERAFWVADTTREGRRRWAALANRKGQESGRPGSDLRAYAWPDGFGSRSNEPISSVLSPSYGSPGRVGRLRGYGNAVNAEAACAFIECADAAIAEYDLL